MFFNDLNATSHSHNNKCVLQTQEVQRSAIIKFIIYTYTDVFMCLTFLMYNVMYNYTHFI